MIFTQRFFTILLSLLLATVLSDRTSALYDPGVGRFCSRDPIGYVDGNNHYRYSHADPLLGLDPSGMCRCCCCPIDSDFSDIEVGVLSEENAILRFEFRFKVRSRLSIQESRVEQPACKIEWFECSSESGSLGQRPGEWFRAPSPTDNPPGNVDSDWQDPQGNTCPNDIERYWADRPTITAATGASTNIKFVVRLRGGDGCGCEKPLDLAFSLHVKIKKFNPLFPEKVQFDPETPTIIPGLTGEPSSCTLANLPN